MTEVGLPIGPRELFLSYLVKVGGPVAETLRMDRRPRPDIDGTTMVTRLADTWEELHMVLCELEGVKAGTRV